MSRTVMTRRRTCGALAAALVSAGCGTAASNATAVAAAPASHSSAGVDAASLLAFRAPLRLDPAAGYEHAEGELWQFVYFSNGKLFDGLTCYPNVEHCAVVDLVHGAEPEEWSALREEGGPEAGAEGEPEVAPFVMHYRVPPDGDWQHASRADLRVLSAGFGEVGAASLVRDAAARPAPGVRERLRAERILRAVYEALAIRYEAPPLGERHFPEARAEAPGPLPCGPTWVEQAEAVDWLGLSAPVVLDWAFSVEADAAKQQLRVVARRDLTCRGDVETLVLGAQLDEYGDFERSGITLSARAPK
jgi:hypothetical protein